VFHHSQVPLVIYLVASFSMTPFSGFLIILNALVHIVMYSYYYLATFPTMVPYLWWKKYITKIQIGQFVVALIYFCSGYVLLPKFCDDPPMVAVVTNLVSALIFLVLFLSFYSSAYKKGKTATATPASNGQQNCATTAATTNQTNTNIRKPIHYE
jgi:elongation of very long chain fatty acids protein 5